MTVGELMKTLQKLKDSLCDLEDMHSFTFGKTSLHIGAEKAHLLQTEFEEECKSLNSRIEELEKELRARDSRQKAD